MGILALAGMSGGLCLYSYVEDVIPRSLRAQVPRNPRGGGVYGSPTTVANYVDEPSHPPRVRVIAQVTGTGAAGSSISWGMCQQTPAGSMIGKSRSPQGLSSGGCATTSYFTAMSFRWTFCHQASLSSTRRCICRGRVRSVSQHVHLLLGAVLLTRCYVRDRLRSVRREFFDTTAI